jgi:hypothetical protein
MSWRYTLACCTGTAHAEQATGCQDRALCRLVPLGERRGEALLAVVADGAGSAAASAHGAALCCAWFADRLALYLSTGEDLAALGGAQLCAWIGELQERLVGEAASLGLPLRDLASTLLVVAVGPEGALFAQIGDGAIVVDDPVAGYAPVFWPQTGEYANQTYFVTDPDAAARLQWQYVERAIGEVALMSDGLQSLALHYHSRSAHRPFFLPMFRALAQAVPGPSAELDRALAAFLESPAVNARTDDDKTLVLAARDPVRTVTATTAPLPEAQ